MALNRIELGTKCTVKSTGEVGTLKKIYFYPTKYELEFSNNQFGHYSITDLEINGIKQSDVKRIAPKIPDKGIGERWSFWSPFKGASQIKHHFLTSKEIMWTMLTSIEMYNVWLHGIQRALPILDTKRYVHRYSFDKFILKPGESFKIRPKTLAPYFKCRIMTIEKEKKFGFTFQTTPLYKEYIDFTIEESGTGVWVTLNRKSSGFFSFLSEFNWEEKSKSLLNLEKITPLINKPDDSEELPDGSSKGSGNVQGGGISSLSKENIVFYLVNKGLDGDMDAVNNHNDKVARGKAKAMMIKIKRGKAEKPPMPDISDTPATVGGGIDSLSKDEMISYLVNKGLDGDMDTVNNHNDKVVRAKAKAMMVKIKRGKAEKPPMPSLDSPANGVSQVSESESEESLMKRLIAKGINGDMDEINNLDNKVLRGKIKAAIVKEKRVKK